MPNKSQVKRKGENKTGEQTQVFLYRRKEKRNTIFMFVEPLL